MNILLTTNQKYSIKIQLWSSIIINAKEYVDINLPSTSFTQPILRPTNEKICWFHFPAEEEAGFQPIRIRPQINIPADTLLDVGTISFTWQSAAEAKVQQGIVSIRAKSENNETVPFAHPNLAYLGWDKIRARSQGVVNHAIDKPIIVVMAAIVEAL